MKDYGLVSIIMPSYNTGEYISESIESVLNQTYSNWKLLIVYDCSRDNTESVVKKYSDERIEFYKNDKNMGAAYSRNFALKKATGDWVAFLDSDDLWFPDKLEKQLYFMYNSDYAFSCTASYAIDEQSNEIGKEYHSPKCVNKVLMHLYCWPGCLTVMYNRKQVGDIQIANLSKNNDYAMWLKVVNKANCYYLNEVLAKYRIREHSISHDKLLRLIKSHYMVFRVGEKKNPIISGLLMCVNMCFGIIKKIVFEKNIK